MQGKIIKGIAGFYYVHASNLGVYECKAIGAFRNKNIKPLVGDNVEFEILDESKKLGNVNHIFPRKNELVRPAVANIDQTLVVFASMSPPPNFNLLSRFLVMMERNDIPTIICFNKCDQIGKEKAQEFMQIFEHSGCKVLITSAVTGEGMDELHDLMMQQTTALAGPSGVGKSTILNEIFPEANSKTGEISEKINRGKHTTRHTEIFTLTEDTYIMDTPGFTNLDYTVIEDTELRFYFNEFAAYDGKCRFNGCIHVNEPGCAVKTAVLEEKISPVRYEIYLEMYKELKDKRKY